MPESRRTARVWLRAARCVAAGNQRPGNAATNARVGLRCGGGDYLGPRQRGDGGARHAIGRVRFYREAVVDREDSFDGSQCFATAATRARQRRDGRRAERRIRDGRRVSGHARAAKADCCRSADRWTRLDSGESGAGKELVARAIHAQSRRAAAPFIEVNSAAIPEELIESELFGHVKGSFTGATSAKKGKFEVADGATLFLDEVSDMSPNVQAKVLRVLEEQRFEPVGSNTPVNGDVGGIAAP